MALTIKQRNAANELALETLKFLRGITTAHHDRGRLENARIAQNKIARVVHLLTDKAAQAPAGELVDHVQPELEDSMQNLGKVLDDVLEPLGYALLVFDQDEADEGATLNYVSNCLRDEIVAAMRQFIEAVEGGE